MTKAELRTQLVLILVKASRRGDGATLTEAQATTVLDALVASDTAPEWSAVRVARPVLRQAIDAYRAL